MSQQAQAVMRDSVKSAQGSGGFFYGRANQEDLYYTFFGTLLAAVTGAKINRKKCGEQLDRVDFNTLDLIHACAWLRAKKILGWITVPHLLRNQFTFFIVRVFGNNKDNKDIKDKNIFRRLDTLPAVDFPHQDKNSPYSQFLLSTLYTDFGKKPSSPDFEKYRLSNGLYANLKNHSEYGLNAASAALFLIPTDKNGDSTDALISLQEEDGSFKAAASAPQGDLLSTATALFALSQHGKTPRIPVKNLLRECFRDNGFFAATPDDPLGDLEYTVYGLLAMGIIE
ncbi:MAG: hypothetical protein FWE57_02075 [Chitinispirillia bacterium]|nr:hypothetical protein [Chitinispirillia bacterium]